MSVQPLKEVLNRDSFENFPRESIAESKRISAVSQSNRQSHSTSYILNKGRELMTPDKHNKAQAIPESNSRKSVIAEQLSSRKSILTSEVQSRQSIISKGRISELPQINENSELNSKFQTICSEKGRKSIVPTPTKIISTSPRSPVQVSSTMKFALIALFAVLCALALSRIKARSASKPDSPSLTSEQVSLCVIKVIEGRANQVFQDITEFLKSGGEISISSLESDLRKRFGDFHVRIFSNVMERLSRIKGIDEIVQEDGTVVIVQRIGKFN